MKLSTVIVTYNNAAMLHDLLSDLTEQTIELYHVIVIDNASTDGTAAIVEAHPAVRYVRLQENLGSSGGYSKGVGLASADSDFIYTLDDDVRLARDTIEKIVEGFIQLNDSGTCRIGAARSVGEEHPWKVPTRLEISPWMGTLLKSSVVREIGPPRNDYFLYGEDLEYSLRLAKHGYCCYWIPSSIVINRRRRGPESNKTLSIYRDPFRLYYAFRNEISIYCEYRCIGKILHTLAFAVKALFFILVAGKPNTWHRWRAVAAGISDGFRGRLGKNPDYIPERANK